MRILFIATDSVDTRYLHKALIEAAHSLECVGDVRDAVFVASSEAFDTVILHMNATDTDAALTDAARELARNVQGAALVVVADLPSPAVRSELLWTGVDACFPRGFSFMELHERIRRLHALREKRRMESKSVPMASASRDVSNPLRLDAQARAAVQGEHRIVLTRHEYLLIECLLRAREAAIDRADITRYAWPDKDDINPASVNLVISRLRKKLESAHFDVLIETVAGVGYRLAHPAYPAIALKNPSF